MSVPPVGTLLGHLTIDEVFIAYDGPKLFSCYDEYGSFYLAAFVDEDDEAEIYLYTAISPARLETLRSGKTSIRQAFTSPLDENLWQVRRFLTTTDAVAQQTSPASIDEDWLPSEDARLTPQAGSSGSSYAPAKTVDTVAHSGTIGEPESIEFRYSFFGDPIRGHPLVRFSIRIAWTTWTPSDEAQNSPVPLSHMVHSLAQAWPYLEWEESSPWGPPAESLTELLADAAADEQAAPADLRAEHAKRNQEFIHRHNLARILQGGTGSLLLAIRDGLNFSLLPQGGTPQKVDATSLLDSLEKLGDTLTSHLSFTGDNADESRAAAEAWRDR